MYTIHRTIYTVYCILYVMTVLRILVIDCVLIFHMIYELYMGNERRGKDDGEVDGGGERRWKGRSMVYGMKVGG